jgi:hypothetical protein
MLPTNIAIEKYEIIPHTNANATRNPMPINGFLFSTIFFTPIFIELNALAGNLAPPCYPPLSRISLSFSCGTGLLFQSSMVNL